MKPLRAREGGGRQSRPHCIACRAPLQIRTSDPDGRTKYACARCRFTLWDAKSRRHPGQWQRGYDPRRPVATPREEFARRGRLGAARLWERWRDAPPQHRRPSDPRPCCLECRRRMTVDRRAARFICKKCGTGCPSGKPPRGLYVNGRPRLTINAAPTPAAHPLTEAERAAEAVRIFAVIKAMLPGYLTPEEREDARQSIALDVLTGELSPWAITPLVLRRYASRSRGMASNRFKFKSLSEPTRDGREFGETLAA